MQRAAAAGLVLAVLASGLGAVETEHLGIQVLPAPGAVAIDGRDDDWDLAGGVFICGDVQTQRDSAAVWFHAMFDADALYLLARFLDDTPLDNPGQTIGDHGFNGDSLQVRLVTAPGSPQERIAHVTAWQGRDGRDLIDVTYGRFGRGPREGNLKDARTEGARQAFRKDAGGRGYTQELALPWRLLTRDGRPLAPGDALRLTVEPNFTVGGRGRLSIKDVFMAGVSIDRAFTFQSVPVWGVATLERRGRPSPRPVRLSDGREVPVRLEGGRPVADWSALDAAAPAEGVKAVRFAMPEDGQVSMLLRDARGGVVRQLLAASPRARGDHEVPWDGLTTPIWRRPGDPVPAGTYRWEAIRHQGIGLRLRGWASNAGIAPWDGPTGHENWGGDHGVPADAATDGRLVFLGWSGAEAGKALVACDFEGRVQWRHTRGGMGGAGAVAVDGGTVYVLDHAKVLYRLGADSGAYTAWEGAASADLEVASLWTAAEPGPDKADALEADAGRVFLGFREAGLVAVLDGRSGRLVRRIAIASPRDLAAAAGRLYVLSAGRDVLAVDPGTGRSEEVLGGLDGARSLALDADGRFYVGLGEPDRQIRVFDSRGRTLRAIGRPGGRALLGPWTPDGVAFVAGMVVDTRGRLWVMEADETPKRVSVWDAARGTLVREFFGPTHYGASGGAINPLDPDVMVGEGCEWRIDPPTGRAACTGVIERRHAGAARFCVGPGGRLYLAASHGRGGADVTIHERLGEGDYRLRATIRFAEAKGSQPPEPGRFWADQNGDGQVQDAEVTPCDLPLTVPGYTGWSFGMNEDLTLYAMHARDRVPVRFAVAGLTPCGAPRYDVAGATRLDALTGLAHAPTPSLDNRLLFGPSSDRDAKFLCYEVESGRLRWWYPNTFHGVHGSHRAPGPQPGLVRGMLAVTGTARLPAPVGHVWALSTNVGEWHVLTEEGQYLARLFEPDPMRVRWPAEARPGAVLDAVPPGAGGEDFGGSLVQGRDGRLYVQAGKVALWNVEVTGLETVRALGGGTIEVTEDDVRRAAAVRVRLLQEATGTQTIAIRRVTPVFTGDLARDFAGAQVVRYEKQPSAAAASAAAWDDECLYLGWTVKDETPWVNGADAPHVLYARGDTVDFQVGADPSADEKRREAVRGDVRLSIGPLAGRPTAVAYRAVADEKSPRVFSSGVVAEYRMDSVQVLQDVRVHVKTSKGGYTVEAAVPLRTLGLVPRPGLRLRGDFGVTHGDAAGTDTMLRTGWNNQATGIVNDEVFELKMEPARWGLLLFQD